MTGCLALKAPGWRGGGGSGFEWFTAGKLTGTDKERERGGGVAGGEGSVEGVEAPDPVPDAVVAIVPRADKELLMVLEDGVRVREEMSKEI